VVGAHLVSPSPDREHDGAEGALLLEAFVAARRDGEVRDSIVKVLDERAELLSELVEAAKTDGSLDPALDTESVVAFCHAVGLGFLIYDAISFALPQSQPWEQLITRLVAALAPSDGTKGE